MPVCRHRAAENVLGDFEVSSNASTALGIFLSHRPSTLRNTSVVCSRICSKAAADRIMPPARRMLPETRGYIDVSPVEVVAGVDDKAPGGLRSER